MLAGPSNSSLLNSLSLTPVYDTSNNFATHTYDWTTGRWTAPEKQKQWWEGRRPANFTVVDLYLDETWNAQSAPFFSQPYSVYFYPQPDLSNFTSFNLEEPHLDLDIRSSESQRAAVRTRWLPSGAPAPWHGNNLAFRTMDYAHTFFHRFVGYGNNDDFAYNIHLVDYGPTQCHTEFAEICSPDNITGVHVYAPAHLNPGTTPPGLDTSKAPDSLLTSAAWLGWHWDWEAVDGTGSSQPYVCELALRELVIPPSIKGISFDWDNTICAHSGRARPFVTNYNDVGPVIYHDDKHTLEPKAAVLSYQAVDLFLANGHYYGNTSLEHGSGVYVNNYHMNEQNYDHVHYITYYHDLAPYGSYLPQWPQYGVDINSNEWHEFLPITGDSCKTSMSDGDRCTLTISPAPHDVWDQAPACARSIPHGVPLLVCRNASQNIVPFGYNRAAINETNWPDPPPPTVPKLRYTAAGKYDTSDDETFQPLGLVPNVPCNRFTYSRRFGGRCAAPVVQYLAYDEAYHTSDAQAKYVGIPEYGGCLDGGLMRFIKPSNSNNNDKTKWNDDSIRKWFTPPMWPYTAWRAASDENVTSTDLRSLYKTDTYTWAAEDLNMNQDQLDGLFIHQKIFQVPDTAPVSGKLVRLSLAIGHCHDDGAAQLYSNSRSHRIHDCS